MNLSLMDKLGLLLLYVFDTQNYTYFIVLGVGIVVLSYLIFSAWYLNKEKKKMEAELEHLNSMKRRGVEYEMVLQAMKLASWRVDLKTRTITFDSDFRTRPGLMTCQPGSDLNVIFKDMVKEDVKKVFNSFEDIINGKTDSFHIQYRMKNLQNEIYWSEAHATVAERDERGRPMVLVGTTACIDEQKKMEEDIINARIQAEESDRLKTAFINNISHEVRTPLNAIVGFSDILPSIDDPEERQNLVAIIKENNSKLLRIFEDMMNISKIEAHNERSNLVVSKFNVVEMVEVLLAKFKTDNANRPIAADFVSQESALDIETDKAKLEYIVKHLLENAFKFTTKGNITAGVNLMIDGQLRIWVSDTGKGIAQADQKRIFDRFFKVDSFVQGAGLGLSVCRSYALSLGGNVGLESQLGQGSTFWVELPLKITQL